MKEAVADMAPISKLNAELESGLRSTNEVGAVQAQGLVVVADGRQGRLANTDRAYLWGLDQHDLAAFGQPLAQGCGRHPPGRAATDDDDLADGRRLRSPGLHNGLRHGAAEPCVRLSKKMFQSDLFGRAVLASNALVCGSSMPQRRW